MTWNEEKIEDALTMLGLSKTVAEGVDKISVTFDEEISASALRKALNRYGHNSPSYYLARDDDPLERSEEPEEENAPEGERDWISMDKKEQEYLFQYYYDKIRVSFADMEEILIKYSNVPPGLGMSAPDIAQQYMQHDKPWARADFLSWMFGTIGFKKSRFPVPPHKVYKDYKQALKAAYNRRDAMIKGSNGVNIIRQMEKELNHLYKEIELIETAISCTDQTLVESEVHSVRYDMTTFKPTFRTLVAHVTDLHNGKLVKDIPFSKQKNVFNQKVFNKRVTAACNIIRNIGQFRGHLYDEVRVAGLGDYFEALLANMRPYQHFTMDNHGAEQYMAVKMAWIKILNAFLESFPHCDIKTIVQGGNHDRLTQEREANSEEILAFMLAENLKDYFKDEERIDINFGAAVVSILYPNGVNHLFIHGHHNGVKNAAATHSFIKLHGFKEAKRTVISSGHYHSAGMITGKDFRHFTNPSFCGDDGYNLDKLLVGSEPEIMFADICDRHDRMLGPYNLNYNLDRAL